MQQKNLRKPNKKILAFKQLKTLRQVSILCGVAQPCVPAFRNSDNELIFVEVDGSTDTAWASVGPR